MLGSSKPLDHAKEQKRSYRKPYKKDHILFIEVTKVCIRRNEKIVRDWHPDSHYKYRWTDTQEKSYQDGRNRKKKRGHVRFKHRMHQFPRAESGECRDKRHCVAPWAPRCPTPCIV